MKADCKVFIIKLNSFKENINIPNNYWVKGTLLKDIKIGEKIQVLRENNPENPIDIEYGMFITSAVKAIVGNEITTENSTYKIEIIEAEGETTINKIFPKEIGAKRL